MTTLTPAFDDADLNGFVDGRIDPARANALAGSLSLDPEARARIDGWKRQNEGLRTLFASVLFEPVPVRLIPTGIPAGSNGRSTPPAVEAARPRAPLAAGALATAVVGVGLIGFALGALSGFDAGALGLMPRPAARPAREPANGLAARALEAHRTYLADAVRPFEIAAADEPRLAHWIRSRLGASARIPDLRALGWSFMGGRVIPGVDGATAFLVFASGAERLALNVARAGPDAGEPDAGPGAAARVASWSDGAFDYAVTTTRDGDWLARNGSAIRASIDAQNGVGVPAP